MTATIRIRRIAGVLGTAAALVIGAAGPANANDTDGNGVNDFVLRENPNMAGTNVGARCELSYQQGAWNLKLSVRPPWVASLWGLQSQRVAWRATFIDARTGAVADSSDWTYGTATRDYFTDFGGGVPQGTMITWAQYWKASSWYAYPRTLGYFKAEVDVAWLNPWSGQWVTRSQPVRWYLTSQNLAASTDRFTGC